jgi:hypothetical protein
MCTQYLEYSAYMTDTPVKKIIKDTKEKLIIIDLKE